MPQSLLDEAIQHADTPEHMALFRDHWLPRALGEKDAAAYTGLADRYLIDFHPGIYHHGPNYQQLVASLTRIETLLDQERKGVCSQLFDISKAYKEFFNFHSEDFGNNPEYAYRTCAHYEKMLRIPGYMACANHQFLIGWAKTLVTGDGEDVIEDITELIDCYTEILLTWDVLRPLPNFKECRTAFERFQRRQHMPES